jgi:salicylate hydroxylase
MTGRKPRIAIVGAGVGGLTLWLALRQRGLSADIYEQASELAEIGAAVALSANATRELGRLGVLDPIVAASTEPTGLIYRDGRTGGRIAAHAVRLGGSCPTAEFIARTFSGRSAQGSTENGSASAGASWIFANAAAPSH